MKKRIMFCVVFILGFGFFPPGRVRADEKESATPTVTSATVSPTPDTFSPDQLKGRLGVGYVIGSPINFTNLRWWFGNQTALDVYLGGSYSEYAETNFTNQTVDVPQWTYGFGLGLRENIAHPTQDVFVQAIQRVTYNDNVYQYSDYIESETNTTTELDGFLGLGFEAFVPFWKNLSLEGSFGIQGGYRWLQYQTIINGQGSPNTTYLQNTGGFEGNLSQYITGLFSTAAHFYF